MRSVLDKIDQALTDLIKELDSNPLHVDKVSESVSHTLQEVLAAIPIAPPADDIPHHQYDHLVFNWLPKFKEFLAFIRDVSFRLYRDQQLQLDGQVHAAREHELNQESKTMLIEAQRELCSDLTRIGEIAKVKDHLAEIWKHFDYPLDILSQQAATILDQITGFPKNRALLDRVRQQTREKANLVQRKLNLSYNGIETVGQNLHELVEKLQALPSHWHQHELNAKAHDLERLREMVETSKSSLEVADAQFDLPGNSSVPIAVENMQLVVKQLNFNQQVRVWFAQEVYPKLVRIHEENLRLFDLTIVTTFNIRNRIQAYLLELEQDEACDATEIVMQLADLKTNYQDGKEDVLQIITEVKELLSKHLVVANIFDPTRDFLDVPIISINQYRRDGSAWLAQSRLKKFWKKTTKIWYNKIRPGLKSNFNLGHVIDFVDVRSLDEDEMHSQALFLKKGFLGQSFNIERQDYVQQLRRAFISWEKGFRGSMLVYGKRLSGRSSLVQSTRHMDWMPHPVIYLQPNSPIEVRSRKYECGTNLAEALNFVHKHHVVDKVCVVIDDLERWRGSNNSFYENIKSLIVDINRFSRKMYFIVVTNHWMKNHLDLYFNFSGQFVDNHSTDKMLVKDISSAILVRESALRAKVSSDEWQEIQAKHKKRAEKIATDCRQNVGASLRAWSRQMLEVPNTTVYSQALLRIVDDYWTILSHLMKYDEISEAELSQVVGASQMKIVNQRLQFLLGCKILVRTRESKLSINDDIVDVLENQMMINSHRKLHAAH